MARQGSRAGTPDDKLCATCGRPFSWRKKWADCWEEVKYCSDRCRSRRNAHRGGGVEAAIFELLEQRQPGATICPSEAARVVWPDDWRTHMEDVREVARTLSAAGRVVITQKGKQVTELNFRGPIRLRLP